MTEFVLDGKEFRIHKLNAMEQFHISRRITPLIPPLLPIFARIARQNQKNEGKSDAEKASLLDNLDSLDGLLQPFADGLANLKDEDSEYVFSHCLSAVRYRSTQTDWVPFWNVAAKSPAFAEHNDLSLMIPLVIRVVRDSLGNFIRGLLTGQGQSETPTA